MYLLLALLIPWLTAFAKPMFFLFSTNLILGKFLAMNSAVPSFEELSTTKISLTWGKSDFKHSPTVSREFQVTITAETTLATAIAVKEETFHPPQERISPSDVTNLQKHVF